jgi:hypothetical protein
MCILEDKNQRYLEDGWMQLENSPSMKYNLDGNGENCDFQLRLQDTFCGFLRRISTARLIYMWFLSKLHQIFISACRISEGS